jgi:hypothetical protein
MGGGGGGGGGAVSASDVLSGLGGGGGGGAGGPDSSATLGGGADAGAGAAGGLGADGGVYAAGAASNNGQFNNRYTPSVANSLGSSDLLVKVRDDLMGAGRWLCAEGGCAIQQRGHTSLLVVPPPPLKPMPLLLQHTPATAARPRR